MRFSKAIRDGAKVYPDNSMNYGIDVSDAKVCGVCALGTAMIYAGRDHWQAGVFACTDAMARRVAEEFPIALKVVPFPSGLKTKAYGGIDLYPADHAFNELEAPVAVIVECLHLHNGWTREATAEWVETIEDSFEPKPEPFKDKVQEGAPAKVRV